MKISVPGMTFLTIAVLTMNGCATMKKAGTSVRDATVTSVDKAARAREQWAAQPRVNDGDRRPELALASQVQPAPPSLDSYASLISDHRAAGIGQTVTVLVLERASSTTSADTRTRSSLDANARLDATFRVDEGGVDVNGTSVGAGSINREGELIASVSAMVTEVLPSGELVIFGEQTIEVNDETQYIRVAGRIRPEDISGDNTVLSTRMADAQIMYKGYGILGETQKPGVLTRFINWVF